MPSFRHKQSDHLPLYTVVRLKNISDTITGASLWWTLLPAEDSMESEALIQKDTGVGGGVTTTPPDRFNWTLTPAELQALDTEYDYYWYCQYKEAATGRLTTLAEGTLTLERGIEEDAL